MLKKFAMYLFRRLIVLVFSDLSWKEIKKADKNIPPERTPVDPFDQLVCQYFGHNKQEMSNKEAYPAACGWKCLRCGQYKLWQHAWTED